MAIKIIQNDMYIRQKDSALINIVFDDGIDITDFIILFTVKVPPGSDETKIQKIITQHDDPLNGVTSIQINSEDTDIERRTYHYNIIVKTPDNQEHTIYPPDPDVIGKFYVEKDHPISDFTVSLNTDNPTITISGWGHTHLNKPNVLDNLTEDHLAFLNSGTIELDDYYNKITDTASSILLNTDNFDNNLDSSIDNTQKLADAVDNMAGGSLPAGGTANDLLQGDGTWQPKNKSLVGLDQVDNTSDSLKIVSDPQQAEIDTKKDDFLENSAFNKNFGVVPDTVAQGDHLHSGTYDTVGSADNAILDHKSSLDPHPQYYDSGSEVKTAYESLVNTNAYTDAEKSKLSSLESSKFLGTYVSLAALELAHSSPMEGSYGHVDTGILNEVSVYIWDSDDNKYHMQMGASSAETAASVKTKYESNPDTNAFTDSEKNNLSNQSGINTGNQDLSGYMLTGDTPALHATSHTNGNDDIQSATNAIKGLATSSQITNLEANTAARNSAIWGNISGDINNQSDLINSIIVSKKIVSFFTATDDIPINDSIIHVSTSLADITLTLPASSLCWDSSKNVSIIFQINRPITDEEEYVVNIAGDGSDKIDGEVSRILYPGESLSLYTNGSSFFSY